MKVIELFAQARDNLQDADADYWHDSELLNLYNECKRHLSAERQEINSTKSVILIDDTNTYTVDGVLRYISVIDSDDEDRELYPDDGTGDDDLDAIIVKNYNSIYVNTPETGVTLSIKVVAFPDDDNLSSTIRSGDENAYKYYLLSKAYEKEQDTENFNKSSYFRSMYTDAIQFLKKNSRMNYVNQVQITEGFYY